MKYFAMIDGRRVGPATIEELVAQGLRPSDYVWHKGLDDWQPAHLDAEICRHFRGRLLDKLHPNMAPVALPDKAEEQVEKAPENMRYGEVRWNINQHDKEPEPSGMPALVPGWLIILSFIAFFPLGIYAYAANRTAARAWNQNQPQVAHEYERRAKMATGISFFLGLLVLATVFHLS